MFSFFQKMGNKLFKKAIKFDGDLATSLKTLDFSQNFTDDDDSCNERVRVSQTVYKITINNYDKNNDIIIADNLPFNGTNEPKILISKDEPVYIGLYWLITQKHEFMEISQKIDKNMYTIEYDKMVEYYKTLSTSLENKEPKLMEIKSEILNKNKIWESIKWGLLPTKCYKPMKALLGKQIGNINLKQTTLLVGGYSRESHLIVDGIIKLVTQYCRPINNGYKIHYNIPLNNAGFVNKHHYHHTLLPLSLKISNHNHSITISLWHHYRISKSFDIPPLY